MKSHGGLFEQVCGLDPLGAAMGRAARGKAGRASVQRFLANAEVELGALREELVAGAYRPRPYTQFRILDPKPRLISCADFRDRVVHHAVCAVLAPAIERRLIDDNFACRAGKGSHRALQRARGFARRFRYHLKTDIRHYYDTIDHGILLAKIRRLFREDRLVSLVEVIVRHPVPGQTPGKGLPIGNLTSQWLANLYLDEIDHWVKEERRAPGYARYMDDLAAWSNSKEFLWELAQDLDARLKERLALDLKREATGVAPSSEGLPFLGWRVYPNILRVRGSRLRRSRRLLRRREGMCARGEIDEARLQACARSMAGLRAFLGFGPPLARGAPARPRGHARCGTTEQRLEPGEPGRELEERRRVELPGGEPQQERPRQPQRQPGLPPREHSLGGKDTELSHPSLPGSRSGGKETTGAPAASKPAPAGPPRPGRQLLLWQE